MKFLRLLWNNLVAPFWNAIIYSLAEGPWGRAFHQGLIDLYKRLFSIHYENAQQFKSLGEFFLRPMHWTIEETKLVSPAHAFVFESAFHSKKNEGIEVKGLEYRFKDFPELSDWPSADFRFWNFYLSPRHYHWFHSPCEALHVEIQFFSGQSFPVNSFGRWLCPFLYSENQRLSFRWESPHFGRMLMMAIGAVGVSRIKLEDGRLAPQQNWELWKPHLLKGERIGAFAMGSSILLFAEKGLEANHFKSFEHQYEVRVGESLIL